LYMRHWRKNPATVSPTLSRSEAQPQRRSCTIIGMTGAVKDLSPLLAAANAGDPDAPDQLFAAVYLELRSVARRAMAGERAGHTLQPTDLVHEAYLRLLRGRKVEWKSRGHFFAAAAEAMRRILIEDARLRGRLKRGGGEQRVELTSGVLVNLPRSEELLALDELLDRLEKLDAEMATVVKLRFFAGLTVEEAAEVLGTSPRSVERLWTESRAWLGRELTRGRTDTRPPQPASNISEPGSDESDAPHQRFS
jgi:RNA polymerase sigma factor (TIGR02999 family)